MPSTLTSQERRELARTGRLVTMIGRSIRKRTFYNVYGEALVGLPADAWHLEQYLMRGWTLQPPAKPKKRPAGFVRIGSGELTPAELRRVNGEEAPQTAAEAAPAGPVATYYTEDGTPVPGLPADPESMKAYLAMGFSLTPPRISVVPLRVVGE